MREFETIKEMVARHEGLKLDLYKCTEGFWTVGYGHNIQSKGITKDIAEALLGQDLRDAEETVKEIFPFYKELTYNRQAVLVDMAFNMGNGLKKFKKMIEALEDRDYETTAKEMEDSAWYTQVGDRSIELTQMMREG